MVLINVFIRRDIFSQSDARSQKVRRRSSLRSPGSQKVRPFRCSAGFHFTAFNLLIGI